MTPSDVSPHEMRRLTNISDRELDAMRNGEVPESDPDLGALARFVGELSEAVPDSSVAHLEDAHIAAMMEAARLVTVESESAKRPASTARASKKAGGSPESGRIAMIKGWFAKKSVKVASGAVALVLAFAGVAVAGVLPSPVQEAVSHAAQTVGVNIPDGVDDAPDEATGVVRPAADGVESTEATSVGDANDQGENTNVDEADDQESARETEADDEESASEAEDQRTQSARDSDSDGEHDSTTETRDNDHDSEKAAPVTDSRTSGSDSESNSESDSESD